MMRRMYIHQQRDWPNLRWDVASVSDTLAQVRYEQGRLTGQMAKIGFDLRQQAILDTLSEDVIKSSEIEGESLDTEKVRSSVARRLGLETGGPAPVDQHVEGIVEVTLDAAGRYDQPLTAERLHDWHAALFPTGRSGLRRINAAAGGTTPQARWR